MALLRDMAEKVRSKNAGPFWLTIDIFCSAHVPVEEISALLPTEHIADLFNADPSQVQRYEQPAIGVLKFSIPRPTIQGTRDDRDMHGASFAILLEELDL